jgi:hypothetical protein
MVFSRSPVRSGGLGGKIGGVEFDRRVSRTFLLSSDEMAERQLRAVVHTRVGETWDLGDRGTLVDSGCRPEGRWGEVLGEQVMLNYSTVVARYDMWKARLTLWLAPQLSCFALRATFEAQQPDDSWILVSEKKAVRVTVDR